MSDRYIKNTFQEYPSFQQNVIIPGEGQLQSEFKKKLLEKVDFFLKLLENRLKSEIDWNDTSVYTGPPGISLLYLHLSSLNITPSDEIITLIDKGIFYVELILSSLKTRQISFIIGDPGPISIAAVLFNKKGLFEQSSKLVKQIAQYSKQVLDVKQNYPDEILYGKSGYLYSLLFIKKYIKDQNYVTNELIRSIIDSILNSGKNTAQKENRKFPPLMYYWHGKAYIGAAHGFAGILFMLLQCKDLLTLDELQNLIKPTIDFILTLQLPSKNYQSSLDSKSDRLVQWCHGAPAVIHLFAISYHIFKEDKYLKAANECSDVIWERGLLTKGYGLCHGAAGNAYGFLKLYQITKDDKQLYRAAKFAEWCLDYGKHGCRTPDNPYSLFEGLAGTIYFLSDLINPKEACFPAYEIKI